MNVTRIDIPAAFALEWGGQVAIEETPTSVPEQPFLYPVIYVLVLYGARFFAFAGFAFWLLDPSRPHPRGRTHIARPRGIELGAQLRREMLYALVTLFVSGLVNGVLIGYGLIRHSLFYLDLHRYPLWWFWASIPVMIALHDTFFYWLHRAMHTRVLFVPMHLLHHRSVYPTAFAAYSFSWSEAFAEALIVTAILFIVPTHPLAFLIFQTMSTAYNVYGHCGRELYPAGVSEHWLGKWLNTSSLHAHHHRYAHGNYSFYFTFWDRLMGTLEAQVSPKPATARPAAA